MSKTETLVHTWEGLPLLTNPNHPKLTQKQLMMPADADKMQVSLHAVLFERLGEGGAVLPHFHDCCEVICITKGEAEAYYQGAWHHHKAGDTLMVPAQEIHSVYNQRKEESEQISFFLPADAKRENRMFETKILKDIPLPKQAKGETTA